MGHPGSNKVREFDCQDIQATIVRRATEKFQKHSVYFAKQRRNESNCHGGFRDKNFFRKSEICQNAELIEHMRSNFGFRV